MERERVRRRRLRKVQNNVSLDIISKLPDSLLLHILSFLPTKYAVRTSILSKRWVNLWIDLQVLFFEFPVSPEIGNKIYANKKVSFTNFVDKVLLLNHASHIKRCRFDYLDKIDSAHKNAWMAALDARQVRELVLRDCVVDMVGPDSYFFVKLFSCESLSTLDICLVGLKYAPNVVNFWLPNLKMLRLYTFESYEDVEEFLQKLLGGCPVLERLYMYLFDFRCIDIQSSTLRILHAWSFKGSPGRILLEAPNVKDLAIFDNIELRYRGKDIRLLTNAYISVPSQEALRAITNSKATTLYLGRSVVYRQIDLEKLRRFDNLTFLNLRIRSTCDHVLGLILGILEKSPRLQNFVLHYFERISHEGDWMVPPCVPQCLLSSLTFFEIHSRKLFESDVDILKYFLRNGAVLKEMRLLGFDKARGTLKKLLTPHMLSSTCTVTFADYITKN